MGNRYISLFNFYGSKSKVAHLYPPPRYPHIIEPFAGAAAYSLRYYDRAVSLYDVDERVAEIWKFVLSEDALEYVRRLPDAVPVGSIVDDVVGDVPRGLVEIARAEANQGTQGTAGIHRQVTTLGAIAWPRLKRRLEFWIPKIRHWRFTQASWETAPNVEATWFVDPPYSNEAGRRYRHHLVDYAALGRWCRDRRGQVIVCEQRGATWLPFATEIVPRRGVFSRYQQSQAVEVVWTQGGEQQATLGR